MPSQDHFKFQLRSRLREAAKHGANHLTISAAELHRELGGNLGPAAQMDYCCAAMKAEMKPGDEIVGDVEEGSALRITYHLPHGS